MTHPSSSETASGLLPCPICAGEVALLGPVMHDTYDIVCPSVTHPQLLMRGSLDEVRKAWNRRSPSPAPIDAGDYPYVHGVTWLLVRDGCVLLERCEKKAKKLGVGEWFVPGGKLEADESASDALRREISEEWPWAKLTHYSPLPIVQGSRVGSGPDGVFLMQPYLVTVSGTPDEETPDGTPLRWTPILDALASPVPQVSMMIAATLSAPLPSSGDAPATPEDTELSERLDNIRRQYADRVIGYAEMSAQFENLARSHSETPNGGAK